MTSVLRTEGLVKRYGGLLVTDEVSLDVRLREIHAVIGPNGAGKTTLINQLSGELVSDQGKVWFSNEDVTGDSTYERARRGLLRSYQITSVFEEFTVRENAVFAATAAGGHAFGLWRNMLSYGDATTAADDAVAAVGLWECREIKAENLGYGERRQLELAMALATRPKILLLDEPLAGMGLTEASTVIALLKQLKSTYSILLIEHDMQAVFSLADRISVLVYGKLIFSGTPDEVRNNAEVRAAYLGDDIV